MVVRPTVFLLSPLSVEHWEFGWIFPRGPLWMKHQLEGLYFNHGMDRIGTKRSPLGTHLGTVHWLCTMIFEIKWDPSSANGDPIESNNFWVYDFRIEPLSWCAALCLQKNCGDNLRYYFVPGKRKFTTQFATPYSDIYLSGNIKYFPVYIFYKKSGNW